MKKIKIKWKTGKKPAKVATKGATYYTFANCKSKCGG